MDKKAIVANVTEAKVKSKKRNFAQSIDISIALKDVNLKDPSKRFRADVLMPHNVSDDVHVCVIGDADVISRAQEAGVELTLNAHQVDEFSSKPNEAKQFISGVDYFLAIPQMMASVGKSLGRYLGPAGKMPTVLPPNAPLDTFVGRYSKTVRIRLRQNPVINVKVANETMDNEDIADNIIQLMHEVEKNLDNGLNNVHRAFVKTTMGPAIQLQL